MSTKNKLLLNIFEAYDEGLIDRETRDSLISEAANEDTVQKFNDLIDSLSSKSDSKIKKKVQELLGKYTSCDSGECDNDDEEDKDDDDMDDDKNDDKKCKGKDCEEEPEDVEEKVNETIENIVNAYRYGYISEATANDLLSVFNEGLYDVIKKTADAIRDKDALKGLSPEYTIDNMYTGIDMYKRGKLEEEEKAKKRAELRTKLNFAAANAGVGR